MARFLGTLFCRTAPAPELIGRSLLGRGHVRAYEHSLSDLWGSGLGEFRSFRAASMTAPACSTVQTVTNNFSGNVPVNDPIRRQASTVTFSLRLANKNPCELPYWCFSAVIVSFSTTKQNRTDQLSNRHVPSIGIGNHIQSTVLAELMAFPRKTRG